MLSREDLYLQICKQLECMLALPAEYYLQSTEEQSGEKFHFPRTLYFSLSLCV